VKEADVQRIVEEVLDKATNPKMNLAKAVLLIEKVEHEAARIGVQAVVAVSNEAARPIAIHCMDDSYIASFDVAVNKAYTVVALKMSTLKLKELSQPGSSLYGIQCTNNGKIVIFGGGVPLFYKGKLIGGLGVSGGTEEQDSALAEYGEKCLEEVM
jgi:uncharacterized protein GlcG (DUF336 family)